MVGDSLWLGDAVEQRVPRGGGVSGRPRKRFFGGGFRFRGMATGNSSPLMATPHVKGSPESQMIDDLTSPANIEETNRYTAAD